MMKAAFAGRALPSMMRTTERVTKPSFRFINLRNDSDEPEAQQNSPLVARHLSGFAANRHRRSQSLFCPSPAVALRHDLSAITEPADVLDIGSEALR